jgi:hypothetical protein
MSLIHMIMLITSLGDPDEFLNLELIRSLPSSIKCGPLSSVIDFTELIGTVSDHTLKREIVPGGCSISVQIYI